MKRKIILLTLIPLLVGCGKRGPKQDPVDENISLTDLKNGLEKIESNFKGSIKETLINDETNGFDQTLSISASFDKDSNGNYHFKRNAYDYDATLNIEELTSYIEYLYDYEPGDSRIAELIEESIYGDIHFNELYSYRFSDEEMAKTDNEVKYHMDVMNFLGRHVDTSNDSWYYPLDYIDYYKIWDGPVSHEYFKGNRRYKRDYNDNSDVPNNNLFYFVYDLKNEVDKAIYDENTKSYSFSSDFLLNYGDFDNEKYEIYFYESGFIHSFNNEFLNDIDLNIEFNSKTKEISKFTLTLKNFFDDLFEGKQTYILEFENYGMLNSRIEVSDFNEICNHGYYNYDYNDLYHYCYCSDNYDCRKVLCYEEHDFDENGECKGCPYVPEVEYDVVGDHVLANSDTVFYYSLNTVTNKISYYGALDYFDIDRLLLNESVVRDEVFQGEELFVYAEKGHAEKDSYYLLVHGYDESTSECVYQETIYSYIYHVENDVPTLIGSAVKNYKDDVHDYKIIRDSITRVDDDECMAKIKCSNCGHTLEGKCNVYLYRDFDFDEWKDTSYLHISFIHNIKSYEMDYYDYYIYDIEYDDQGFELLTHTHREREFIGTEVTGLNEFEVRYNEDGSLWFVCERTASYTWENIENGYKKIYSSFGENVVILTVTEAFSKEPGTCFAHLYVTYKLEINGVTIFEKTSGDEYIGEGEAVKEHNFKYVADSLVYNPYFDEYTFKVKCDDCGQEFLVEKYVSIIENHNERTHDLTGYYCYSIGNYVGEKSVRVTCDCEPNEEDKNFCKWCEGYIGEIL